MTANTISGTYSAGYLITVDTLVNLGTISGPLMSNGIGLYSAKAVTVTNGGHITPGSGNNAISLHHAGIVANQSDGVIAGLIGITMSGGIGTVANSGVITGAAGDGVAMTAGQVNNTASAMITGGRFGVYISGSSAGTVVNAGSIAATNYAGVVLTGGTVSNLASGVITGGRLGVYISGSSAGTLINAGTIISTTYSGAALVSGGFVSNASSGFIKGQYGIGLAGGTSETVINRGSVVGTKFDGVVLAQGSASNAASGSIIGVIAGVLVANGPGTVANDGFISATAGAGVSLVSGGQVSNAASALITGSAYGVDVAGGAIDVINAGSMVGTSQAGLYLKSSGLVTNAASGSIRGKTGVELAAGGTLTNAGLIVGGSGTAVTLGGSGYNLLVVDPGAAFSGLVSGSATASNTLELASSASTGNLGGLGTQFTNFGSIVFNPGARWDVAGIPGGFSGTISGFTLGDTIEITGITATGSFYFADVLTLSDTSGDVPLNIPGSFTTDDFIVNNVPGGVLVSVTCFRDGTSIRTTRGNKPVEMLRVGQTVLVMARDGRTASRPITWIGHRSVDCRRHPRPELAWPVRIHAKAFGSLGPERDLFLSPDHAVLVDDVLIPVKHLINGSSIEQVRVDRVTYYHIELDEHSILFAEGLPTESYLDAGDRSRFVNGGGPVMLHADFASRTWETQGCRPLVVIGAKLDATRRLLRSLAGDDHSVAVHLPRTSVVCSPRRGAG